MIRLPYWVACMAIVALLTGAILVYLQFARIAEDSQTIRELKAAQWEGAEYGSPIKWDAK